MYFSIQRHHYLGVPTDIITLGQDVVEKDIFLFHGKKLSVWDFVIAIVVLDLESIYSMYILQMDILVEY